MFKKMQAALLFSLSLTLSQLSFAEADYAVTWSVSGIDNVGEIKLEFTEGTQFYSAVGIIQGSGSPATAVPLSGSCFVNTDNNLNCSFFIGFGNTGILVVNLDDYSGVWRTFDVQGTLVETGQVAIESVN